MSEEAKHEGTAFVVMEGIGEYSGRMEFPIGVFLASADARAACDAKADANRHSDVWVEAVPLGRVADKVTGTERVYEREAADGR